MTGNTVRPGRIGRRWVFQQGARGRPGTPARSGGTAHAYCLVARGWGNGPDKHRARRYGPGRAVPVNPTAGAALRRGPPRGDGHTRQSLLVCVLHAGRIVFVVREM